MPTACIICGGSGLRIIVKENGDRFVGDCSCSLEGKLKRTLERACIPQRYAHCSLAEYFTDFSSANNSLVAAHHYAQSFVARYPAETGSRGLLLTGSIGVGKTHLAVGILKQVILGRGASGLFCDYRDLLKQVQNTYNQRSETTEMQILEPLFKAEVLVIDELGASKPTEWVWDTIAHILNTRYNDCRTTIITTNYANLPPLGSEAGGTSASAARTVVREETLGDRIGERMRSRLQEMCVVMEMRGKDFRQSVNRADYA